MSFRCVLVLGFATHCLLIDLTAKRKTNIKIEMQSSEISVFTV